MTAELKPCPFCGSEAQMCYTPGNWGYTPGYYYVSCTSCAATSFRFEDEKWESGKGTRSISKQAMESATAWWNRRPVESAAPARELSDAEIESRTAHLFLNGRPVDTEYRVRIVRAALAAPTDSKLLGDSTLMHITLNGTQYEALVFPAGYFKKEARV